MATIRTLVTATFAAVFAAGPALVDTAAGGCDPRSRCPASAPQSAGTGGSPFDFMKSLFEVPTPAKRNASRAKPESARGRPASPAARMGTAALRQSGRRTQKPLPDLTQNDLPVGQAPLAMLAWRNEPPFQGLFANVLDNENPVLRDDAWFGVPVVNNEEVKIPEGPIRSILIANADELNEIDLAAPDLSVGADQAWLHALMAMGCTVMVLLVLAGTLAAISPERPIPAS